jgi:hypothetical protein
MSYSMYINVKDGMATVDSVGYAAPPDGRYAITGHVPTDEPNSWDAESITAMRFSETGVQLAQATASVLKAR